MRARHVILVAVIVAAAALPGRAHAGAQRAAAARAESPSARRLFTLIAFARTRWDAVSALEPVARTGGLALAAPFDRSGWGVGVVMQRRVLRRATSSLFVGGEFEGAAHESPWRDAGIWLPSGKRVRARLYANASLFALSARASWRTTHPTTLHATAGAGLYLLGVKDWVEGDGEVETGNTTSAPGGFAGLGLDRACGRLYGVHLEARVHAFRFRRLGGDFPGESAGGPLYELSAGVSGWTR